MNTTDPIADLLTRIRNAGAARHRDVRIPASKIKYSIVETLHEEGYIDAFSLDTSTKFPELKVKLRYHNNRHVITGIQRVSKPGQRRYVKAAQIPDVRNGFGTAILSTSSGILTGQEAKEKGFGGELLCYVW